jgi:hypothetical protein
VGRHEEIERFLGQRPELRPAIESARRFFRRLKLLLVFVAAVLLAIPLASVMGLVSVKTALLTLGSVVAALAFSFEWMRRSGRLTFYTARVRKRDEC